MSSCCSIRPTCCATSARRARISAADINTSGNTSDGYFGLTWGIMLIQNLFGNGDGIFANGSLGGAVHNGYLDSAPPDRKKLGSRILFRESLELGYQINPVVSVSAILDHISNANLASHNAGITSAGARIGFRFLGAQMSIRPIFRSSRPKPDPAGSPHDRRTGPSRSILGPVEPERAAMQGVLTRPAVAGSARRLVCRRFYRHQYR